MQTLLDRMDRNDKKYIDDSNVESFKDEFDSYFKDLNEDVNTITEVSKLPTSTVNKVGLITLASAGFAIILGLVSILRKRWFL